jgi:hypothetical protein
MAGNSILTGTALEPPLWERLPLPSITRRKRATRPIKGGEADVMRLIGERPTYEGDVDLGPRQLPPRQPWV